MKRITQKERQKAGNIYCIQCKKKGKKVNAVYRPSGDFRNTVCEEHKELIKENNHLTGADYQTWMRI